MRSGTSSPCSKSSFVIFFACCGARGFFSIGGGGARADARLRERGRCDSRFALRLTPYSIAFPCGFCLGLFANVKNGVQASVSGTTDGAGDGARGWLPAAGPVVGRRGPRRGVAAVLWPP